MTVVLRRVLGVAPVILMALALVSCEQPGPAPQEAAGYAGEVLRCEGVATIRRRGTSDATRERVVVGMRFARGDKLTVESPGHVDIERPDGGQVRFAPLDGTCTYGL